MMDLACGSGRHVRWPATISSCGYNKLVLTWDDAKRIRNLQERGLDFADAEAIFDGPVISQEDNRVAYGEQRINIIGFLREQVVHMTYTERGDDLHVISLRLATKHEARYFLDQIDR